jgi:tryptophan dimethylallyltransferase
VKDLDAVDHVGEASSGLGGAEKEQGTLGALLLFKLRRLLGVVHQEEKFSGGANIAALLATGWASSEISMGPAWPSDITDDHTPFELSLAFGARGETVRILTEPQEAANPSALASWQLAARIHERLASEWGADLSPLARVADLFEPSASTAARFAIWHSAILNDPVKPDFKVYLNPALHGTAHSLEVTTQALERLGLGESWRLLSKSALRRGSADVPLYLSLDLSGATQSRVKVYIAHYGATAGEVAAALRGCPGYGEERVSGWVRHLMGGPGPYTSRPPLTCFAFCRGALEPHSATLHLPVRCYHDDDFEIGRRVCGLLSFSQRVRYLRVLTSSSDRPLDAARGLQTYASLRNSPGRQGVTLYLAPEAFTQLTSKAARSVHEIFEDSAPVFSPGTASSGFENLEKLVS